MSVLFHLGHPAHFHLFKHVIDKLREDNYKVHILIKEKDVLKSLLNDAGLSFENILPEGKSEGKFGEMKDLFTRGRRMIAYCKEHKPKLLAGTSADIGYVGKYLGIPTLNINEDDASIVPKYAWLSYPFATKIISPVSCNNGRWSSKTIRYEGYHELAYLHPDLFHPDKQTVAKYTDPDSSFFLMRFSNLSAHHDAGIRGIGNKLARDVIDILTQFGKVIIVSERDLDKKFQSYKMKIKPEDLHHLIAFANLVVGDSQTMSAEAGVLGTPFIRFNDFVGKIGYLEELEEKYKLGYGISPNHPDKFLEKVQYLASSANKEWYKKQREIMLTEKINVAEFLFTEIKSFL